MVERDLVQLLAQETGVDGSTSLWDLAEIHSRARAGERKVLDFIELGRSVQLPRLKPYRGLSLACHGHDVLAAVIRLPDRP